MRFLLFFMVSMFFLPAHVLARDCDKARSSADVMGCLNVQYEAAQGDLNKAFDKLVSQNASENLAEIKDIQMRWLGYRDLECTQETAALETEALKRLENLRCINRLTQERIVAIQSGFSDEKVHVIVGEVSGQPRWMNALASDNPDIFWRYGARIEGDLDCDGEVEYIMSGLHVTAEAGVVKPFVSISENPVTGRPESVVVALESRGRADEGDVEEEVLSCGLLTTFKYIEGEKEESADEEEALVEDTEEIVSKTCTNYLVVSAENCTNSHLSWDGQTYVFGE